MKKTKAIIAVAIGFLILSSCGTGRHTDGNWEPVFNGKDLSEWKDMFGSSRFTVEDEMMTITTPSTLFYSGKVEGASFKNFEFKADVKTSPEARATLYFHTSASDPDNLPGYAVQILNSSVAETDFRKTGSLLAIRDVYKSLANDEEWFNLHVVVTGNRVLVYVNDVQTVDYTQPENVTREANLAQRILSTGTFAIRTYGQPVSFRNIMVMPLADDSTLEPGKEYFTEEKQQLVNSLIERGYPMIDYHIHMKGGVTLEDILDKSRRTGIFCSVAPNCGIGFPVDTNEKLEDFYKQYATVPIFLAMQAEGREWVTTFEKESIARYDYVFTDAMTFSDRKGKRMQIWIDEQVEITDAQDFMELLVATIENVLDNEKIDIYVNATFLPTFIADRYDELWTEERMERVVDALVRNDIAFEISARYKIPSAEFIRRAKAKGVKFTFGTNNGDQDFANLDYCLQMIDECNLQPQDFFLPRPHGMKPVQVKL